MKDYKIIKNLKGVVEDEVEDVVEEEEEEEEENVVKEEVINKILFIKLISWISICVLFMCYYLSVCICCIMYTINFIPG